jgi:hypothetical protein
MTIWTEKLILALAPTSTLRRFALAPLEAPNTSGLAAGKEVWPRLVRRDALPYSTVRGRHGFLSRRLPKNRSERLRLTSCAFLAGNDTALDYLMGN